MSFQGMSKNDLEEYADKVSKKWEVKQMNANEFIIEYAKKNHPNEPDWLQGRIDSKIKSVGGLLTEDGAMMVLAGEKGWGGMEQSIPAADEKRDYERVDISGYTDLSADGLDLLWDATTLGNGYRKYPKEPLVVKIIRVYDAQKPKFGFAKMATGTKISDGENELYFNFEDKEAFHSEKNGKDYPANMMSSAIQQVRAALIGKTIAIFNWELFKGQKGYSMTSTAYTYFRVVDDPEFVETNTFDEVTTEEVIVEEIEGI